MRVEGRRALWWLLWVWCYGVGVVSGEQGHWAPRAGAERFKVSHKAPPPYQTPPLTTHGGHYYHAPPLPQAPPPPFPQVRRWARPSSPDNNPNPNAQRLVCAAFLFLSPLAFPSMAQL